MGQLDTDAIAIIIWSNAVVWVQACFFLEGMGGEGGEEEEVLQVGHAQYSAAEAPV